MSEWLATLQANVLKGYDDKFAVLCDLKYDFVFFV